MAKSKSFNVRIEQNEDGSLSLGYVFTCRKAGKAPGPGGRGSYNMYKWGDAAPTDVQRLRKLIEGPR